MSMVVTAGPRSPAGRGGSIRIYSAMKRIQNRGSRPGLSLVTKPRYRFEPFGQNVHNTPFFLVKRPEGVGLTRHPRRREMKSSNLSISSSQGSVSIVYVWSFYQNETIITIVLIKW